MSAASRDTSMQDVTSTTPQRNSATPVDAAPASASKGSNAANAKPALPTGIVPANKASTAPTQDIIERYAPGSAPHWVGISAGTKEGGGAVGVEKPRSATATARNLPVKRYDGEPLSRSDLQHNVLSQLFGSTERCFVNPRPGSRGPKGSLTWRCPVPVYPQGMAPTCARPSDETEEEFKEWQERAKAFEKAPFLPVTEEDTVYTIDNYTGSGHEQTVSEAEANSRDGGKTTLPPLLRKKEGFPPPGNDMLTFKELYMEALLHSGKCTKAMRDKMLLDEEFAEDFAKVCLLVNVGRINTTLAFYPEMKTILRSYHPLPSLQRNENSRRHLQDAPRMKSLLKAVLLDGEKPGLPGSGTATGALAAKNAKAAGAEGESEEAPGDIADLVRRLTRNPGRPPTSIVTVIFLMATHSSEIATLHFEHPHDFFSIFFPHPDYAVPSKERARVFLWLIWHYLEGGVLLPPCEKENPFDDDFSRESARKARAAWDAMTDAERQKIQSIGYWKGVRNPKYADFKKRRTNTRDESGAGSEDVPAEYDHRVLAPKLTVISNALSALENADTEEEVKWGVRMKEERSAFLVRFQEEEQAKINESNGAGGGDGAGRDGDGATVTGKDKANKKRMVAGGGSSYPLANILAAANAEKAAAAAAATAAAANADADDRGVEGGYAKRARLEGSLGRGGEYDKGSAQDPADTLWDLDLTLPTTFRPPRNHIDLTTNKITARTFSSPGHHSLPRLAWRRILERAQRGVGDASYESDEEEQALDEARDERPRAEMARIVSCLREIRTNREEIRGPTPVVAEPDVVASTVPLQTTTVEQHSAASGPSSASIAAAEAELAELL